jgi:hypothetical protein
MPILRHQIDGTSVCEEWTEREKTQGRRGTTK